MRILLTGSSGGIGSAIKEVLKDHEVICVRHADPAPVQLIDIDWLICAHGVIDEEDILGTFMANTISSIYLAEQLKNARIIFISSTAARGNDTYPIYAASKAALNTYCKSISKKRECYAICPGPTDTPMWQRLDIPGKAQSPTAVADAVSRIINSAGIYTSGDIITVRNGTITL